jgi:hypothetical protein
MRTIVRNIFFINVFICLMQSINSVICEYVNREWIGPWSGSIRSFATEHDIDEKTVRKIVDYKTTPYSITLHTLEKMCIARKITLEKFFSLIKR